MPNPRKDPGWCIEMVRRALRRLPRLHPEVSRRVQEANLPDDATPSRRKVQVRLVSHNEENTHLGPDFTMVLPKGYKTIQTEQWEWTLSTPSGRTFTAGSKHTLVVFANGLELGKASAGR